MSLHSSRDTTRHAIPSLYVLIGRCINHGQLAMTMQYYIHVSFRIEYLYVQQLLLLSIAFFSRTTWVSRYQTGKTSLDLNEARNDGVMGCSGKTWTICKQSAPHSREITTPTPRHSIFTGRILFLKPNQ